MVAISTRVEPIRYAAESAHSRVEMRLFQLILWGRQASTGGGPELTPAG